MRTAQVRRHTGVSHGVRTGTAALGAVGALMAASVIVRYQGRTLLVEGPAPRLHGRRGTRRRVFRHAPSGRRPAVGSPAMSGRPCSARRNEGHAAWGVGRRRALPVEGLGGESSGLAFLGPGLRFDRLLVLDNGVVPLEVLAAGRATRHSTPWTPGPTSAATALSFTPGRDRGAAPAIKGAASWHWASLAEDPPA